MRPSLTAKQKEVYDFIKQFWEVEERCPSLREVCEGRINNKQILEQRTARSTAHAIIGHLVSKNYLSETYYNDRPSWHLSRELDQ
jgi:SOS-response transcriptional repressor LexA